MKDRELRNENPKITALICALNEESNLHHTLPKIPEQVHEILLVDGHSSDKTVLIAKELCPRIKVVVQPNKGKDDAMKYGVEQASGDIIVMLDADGANDPSEIPRFINPLLKGYDFVKGSRFSLRAKLKIPWYRRIGNRILASTTNLLFGTKYTDVCSGYNAFWKSSWQRIKFPEEFGYEPLITIRALKANLKIVEMPYADRGRISGKSKLPNWRQGWGALKAIIRERFSD